MARRAGTHPDLPAGERVYAIGDVHGRLDLFARLIAAIRRDGERRGAARTRIVLLGDVIDRGPASAQLVALCRAMTIDSSDFIVLRGNHEAMLTQALTGDLIVLARWLEMGGDAALASWGVPEDLLRFGATPQLVTAARHAVPAQDAAWLRELPLTYQVGNCLFVHAGIRPGVALRHQRAEDLLSIRDPFLSATRDDDLLVVHGHAAIPGSPAIRQGRIDIDTGAYRTGRLTALGLEGDAHWLLATAAAAAPPPVPPGWSPATGLGLAMEPEAAMPVSLR